MKQILQNLSNGETILEDVPCPQCKRGELLIQTCHSLVSAGTERMLVEFGRANLLDKARQQPDKIKMVIDKIHTDGLLPTLEAVRNKLDQPLPLGYCNAGVVIETGSEVEGFAVGDLVASNGKHAEVVSVPVNLCSKIPLGVSTEHAAFTVIGAIALQGIRLAQPTLGEGFVVTGIGLIGLITVQLLRANGCRVLAIDFDEEKLAIARRFGADTANPSLGDDVIATAQTFSQGRGVDGVILTASTKSSEPVHQAALMCRKRGRIILVGVTGLELSRDDFFEKELTFQVSCSYGPGRYDALYEEQGQDYPYEYVRWTEQRNFEAVLDMISGGQIDVEPLISHRFALSDCRQAYDLVGSNQPCLGIILTYGGAEESSLAEITRRTVKLGNPTDSSITPSFAFIGAGNYAGQVLIPAFHNAGVRLKSVASAGGISGAHVGRKNSFEESTTDIEVILNDPDVHAVIIATRHNAHAQQVCEALKTGKHVFVEKPLALDRTELDSIAKTYDLSGNILTVGFNRRFAPQIQQMKKLLDTVKEPKSFIITINAGSISADHWTQDKKIGGGRIIGEACHFIDLLRFLAGCSITGVQSTMIGGGKAVPIREDKMSFTLRFEDGSIGTVHYLSNGSKSFPKERIEVFCAGRVIQIDNFRKMTGWGWSDFKKMNLWRQDKGNSACAKAFIEAVRSGGPEPIPFAELIEVTRVSFEVVESALK